MNGSIKAIYEDTQERQQTHNSSTSSNTDTPAQYNNIIKQKKIIDTKHLFVPILYFNQNSKRTGSCSGDLNASYTTNKIASEVYASKLGGEGLIQIEMYIQPHMFSCIAQ